MNGNAFDKNCLRTGNQSFFLEISTSYIGEELKETWILQPVPSGLYFTSSRGFEWNFQQISKNIGLGGQMDLRLMKKP